GAHQSALPPPDTSSSRRSPASSRRAASSARFAARTLRSSGSGWEPGSTSPAAPPAVPSPPGGADRAPAPPAAGGVASQGTPGKRDRAASSIDSAALPTASTRAGLSSGSPLSVSSRGLAPSSARLNADSRISRSEERRVGKEWRSRREPGRCDRQNEKWNHQG